MEVYQSPHSNSHEDNPPAQLASKVKKKTKCAVCVLIGVIGKTTFSKKTCTAPQRRVVYVFLFFEVLRTSMLLLVLYHVVSPFVVLPIKAEVLLGTTRLCTGAKERGCHVSDSR